MKIALHLYALRNYIRKNEELIKTLTAIKAMGFEAIQVSGLGNWNQERLDILKESCQTLGLEIAGTHLQMFPTDESLDSIVEQHKALNTSFVGIGSMPESYNRQDLTHYQEFIIKYSKMAKYIDEKGLILTYHHHAFEFSKMNGLYPIDIILQHMYTSPLKLEVDVYWLQYSGINILEFIKKHQKLIANIHIKDMRISIIDHWHTEQKFCPIGEGNINYKYLIPQLRLFHIPWLIIGQDDFYGEDPWEQLSKSLSYIRSLV